MKRNKLTKISLIVLMLLITVGVELLFARAGGSGSSSSGSSGGGDLGIIYLIFYLMRVIPFPFNFIILGIVIFLYISANKKQKKNRSAFRDFPTQSQGGQAAAGNVKGYSAFLKQNPDFNEGEFLYKVDTAFMGIQKAWSEKEISKARRYISDGVNQRFLTQIEMMGILKQTNVISNIEIDNIWIDKIESDGDFDIIHAGISAYANDIFKSELSRSLNSDVSEDFIEYWSFIRKKSSKNKDLYGTVECPNCKAPLDGKDSDVVKCTFCGTLLNNGDYDWILSEITQANDYAASRTSRRKLDHVASEIAKNAFSGESSVQLLEDKASNAYLQIVSALAAGKT
ncbi:MAG: zinc-ribbon domain-containing transport protein, partial [Spirochaetota bacterium]|nr:zinc-ribbon domain-containing transport protein [Spirochaetota bacterium]